MEIRSEGRRGVQWVSPTHRVRRRNQLEQFPLRLARLRRIFGPPLASARAIPAAGENVHGEKDMLR
jgi:hypothetical protein